MSRRRRDPPPGHPDMAGTGLGGMGLGGMGLGGTTWLGLAVAGLGWGLLVGEVVAGEALAAPARLPAAVATLLGPLAGPGLRADLLVLAPCLIGSGFALAVVGTLRAGFGALDRFFGAALARSLARAEEARQGAQQGAGQGAQQGAQREADTFDAGAAVPREAARGDADPARRPYRTLPDGSVEVETIVGTRRFASMSAAREFI